MGHFLGPGAHVCIESLVEILPAMKMEIWDCECRPLWLIIAAFAVSGQVGNRVQGSPLRPSPVMAQLRCPFRTFV